LKVRELEALLRKAGWTMKKRTGTNHRHWTKPGEGRIIISGNATSESDKGQEQAVLRKLGM